MRECSYLVILSGIIRNVSEWSKVKTPKGNDFVRVVMQDKVPTNTLRNGASNNLHNNTGMYV